MESPWDFPRSFDSKRGQWELRSKLLGLARLVFKVAATPVAATARLIQVCCQVTHRDRALFFFFFFFFSTETSVHFILLAMRAWPLDVEHVLI
jgi:hypothetical protein